MISINFQESDGDYFAKKDAWSLLLKFLQNSIFNTSC